MNLVYRYTALGLALNLAALLSANALAADTNRKPAFAPARAQTPQPSASPHPSAATTAGKPREHLIQFGAASAQVTPVAIVPRKSAQSKPADTSFKLSPTAPGKLLLAFETTNPQLEISPRGGFVIQMAGSAGIEVTPALITRAEWPKENKLVVTYKGAPAPGEAIVVQGKAAYTVCDKRTKNCKKVLSPFSVEVR